MPHTGELACNPGMCPRLGIELTTLWFAGQCSIYLATPARALYGLNFHFLPSLTGWTLQLSTVGYSFIVCLIISFGSRIYCFGPIHWPLKYTPLQSINIILINIVLLYFTIGWLTSTSNLHWCSFHQHLYQQCPMSGCASVCVQSFVILLFWNMLSVYTLLFINEAQFLERTNCDI